MNSRSAVEVNSVVSVGAAGGTLVNLAAGLLLWLALRNAKTSSMPLMVGSHQLCSFAGEHAGIPCASTGIGISFPLPRVNAHFRCKGRALTAKPRCTSFV